MANSFALAEHNLFLNLIENFSYHFQGLPFTQPLFNHQANSQTNIIKTKPIPAETTEITNSAEPGLLANANAMEITVKKIPILKKCLRRCGAI